PERELPARLMLWLLIAAAAAAVVIFIIAHRRRLSAWLSKLRLLPAIIAAAVARLRAWLTGLFSRAGGRAAGAGALPEDPFVDIFARGLADDLEPAQVIDYVYRAFQVYMERRGFQRAEDQTALEFLRSIPRHALLPDRAAERLTRAYILATYSPREVTRKQVEGARETWLMMKRLLEQTGGA
ncbi:MAG: DUF4129 domain-containing protein, partial [Armatimonadetes bacterium]|nr:DUF4129 domain-containing protein [Armatimonadota bacterium]